MDYSELTRDQLIRLIDELGALNRVLMKEKQQETGQRADWKDCLGHWYWNLKTDTITFNPYHATSIGYGLDEIPESFSHALLERLFHPEDYRRTMDAIEAYIRGEIDIYDAEFRLRTKNGEYRWFYDRGRVSLRDPDGSPRIIDGIVFDITDRKKRQLEIADQNKVLAEMSYIDDLTKVSNHRGIMDRLASAMEEGRRRRRPVSIALFDIDDFKSVNDSHGHIYGDQVLVGVAALLRRSLRDSDFVGRYGGDEFLAVFTNSDAGAAYVVAERVREAIYRGAPVDGIHITVSGGVAQYGGERLTAFIHAADMNLYEAKKRGKNRIVCSPAAQNVP